MGYIKPCTVLLGIIRCSDRAHSLRKQKCLQESCKETDRWTFSTSLDPSQFITRLAIRIREVVVRVKGLVNMTSIRIPSIVFAQKDLVPNIPGLLVRFSITLAKLVMVARVHYRKGQPPMPRENIKHLTTHWHNEACDGEPDPHVAPAAESVFRATWSMVRRCKNILELKMFSVLGLRPSHHPKVYPQHQPGSAPLKFGDLSENGMWWVYLGSEIKLIYVFKSR